MKKMVAFVAVTLAVLFGFSPIAQAGPSYSSEEVGGYYSNDERLAQSSIPEPRDLKGSWILDLKGKYRSNQNEKNDEIGSYLVKINGFQKYEWSDGTTTQVYYYSTDCRIYETDFRKKEVGNCSVWIDSSDFGLSLSFYEYESDFYFFESLEPEVFFYKGWWKNKISGFFKGRALVYDWSTNKWKKEVVLGGEITMKSRR